MMRALDLKKRYVSIAGRAMERVHAINTSTSYEWAKTPVMASELERVLDETKAGMTGWATMFVLTDVGVVKKKYETARMEVELKLLMKYSPTIDRLEQKVSDVMRMHGS